MAPDPHRGHSAAARLLVDLRGVKEKARRCLGPLPLAALAAALAACASPPLRPETAAGTGAIVQEAAGLRVAVEAEAWHGRPKRLTDYVLPFLVQVKNTGNTAATIERTDFLLLDDARRQYAPLPPSEVIVLLNGRTSGLGIFPSIGVTGSTAGGAIIGAGLGISLEDTTGGTEEIMTAALSGGVIQPGGESQGFLYFPLPAPPSNTLRVICILRQLPGPPRLEFAFRRR